MKLNTKDGIDIMKYLENELKRARKLVLSNEISELHYMLFYTVQQSLEWALNPTGYKSPVDTILDNKVLPLKDTQANLKDCLAVHHQPQSLNTCSQNDLLPQ